MSEVTERSAEAVISVMPETREGVELLRRRLALFWGTVGVVCAIAFVPTQLLGVLSLGKSVASGLIHPGTLVQLASLVVVAGIWYWCRYRRPTRSVLETLDAVAVVEFCGGGAFMTYAAPGAAMPALDLGGRASTAVSPGLLAVVVILTLRAALIPSTPRRTVLVSLLGVLPLAVAAILIEREDGSPAAVTTLAMTLIFAVLVVPFPTIISAVIYRLQRQVDEAKQLGQYTLEAKIGEGGMGVVYRARHALLRRPTAIKLLPPERAGAEALSRFQREVQQTSRLSHPNTVAIYDFGTTASGIFYYAMEYLDGVSLQELVDHDGPQPAGRVAHILRQACGALAEAHAAGLVHRDIKPANLHLCSRGGVADHVKVLDFGLVKDVSAARAEPSLTSAGSLLGTPLYLAPEAISDGDAVDGRADLYALGAVGYFLLTGSAPFPGKTLVEVCSQHLHIVPEPPSSRLGREVPEALEALVLRCLEKAPSARPGSARELGRALDLLVATYGWTEDDAEGWWQQRGRAVLELIERERGDSGIDTGESTVAVDFESRAPA